MNTRPDRWVLRRNSTGAAASRLFCFCYAGGNASVFLPWQEALGPDVEVCAIQLPGRGARFAEALPQDVASVSAGIALAIEPLLDRPFSFFGHSLGALIAYEVAHQLRGRRLRMPAHLVVSGTQGPRVRTASSKLHLLDDEGLSRALARYAGTPTQVLESSELLALVLPIIRADFRMASEYVAPQERESLRVPITVFAGREDEVDDVAHYEDWFKESSAGGKLHWFEGNHFFINSASDQVLSRLKALLAPSGLAAALGTARV